MQKDTAAAIKATEASYKRAKTLHHFLWTKRKKKTGQLQWERCSQNSTVRGHRHLGHGRCCKFQNVQERYSYNSTFFKILFFLSVPQQNTWWHHRESAMKRPSSGKKEQQNQTAHWGNIRKQSGWWIFKCPLIWSVLRYKTDHFFPPHAVKRNMIKARENHLKPADSRSENYF